MGILEHFKIVKIAVYKVLKLPNLISRKIYVSEKISTYSVSSLVISSTSFLLSKNFRLELWPNRLADFWFFNSGWKFEVSITLNKLLKKIDQKMILFFQKRRVKNEAVFESVFSVYKICVFFMHPFFAVCGECVREPQLWFLVCTFLLALTIYIELQKSNCDWRVQDSQAFLQNPKTLLKYEN